MFYANEAERKAAIRAYEADRRRKANEANAKPTPPNHEHDPTVVTLGLDPSNGGDNFGIAICGYWDRNTREILNGAKARLGWDAMSDRIAEWYVGAAEEFPNAKLVICLDGTASHGLSLTQVERIVAANPYRNRTAVISVTFTGQEDQGKSIRPIPGTSPRRYSLSRQELLNGIFQDFTDGSLGVRALDEGSRKALKTELKGLRLKRGKVTHGRDGDDLTFACGLASSACDTVAAATTTISGPTRRQLELLKNPPKRLPGPERRDAFMTSRGL